MRAHLLQLDLVWEDRAANHELVEQTLDGVDLEHGDLVVLPELFDSGFSLNTDATADREGATLRYLIDLADDLGVVIQGSRTVRDRHCNKATNRATIAGPGQRLLCEYSKIHPFGYGREPEAFEGGRSVETYEWSSRSGRLTVCPAVCYDLRFPELFREGVSLGAECFALGANWPAARAHHWRALLIARAIENQAFVLGVNRCGKDPHLEYAGGTIAIGPKGDVLDELGPDPGALSVELDPEEVRAWRTEFPALEDRVL